MGSAPKNPKINWLHCMGDSITNSDYTLFIPKSQQYTHRLQVAIGGNCRARNFGIPGNTSTQMLARFADMTKKYIPTVSTIYSGINDTASDVSGGILQSNLESMVDQLKNAGCNRIILCNIHNLPGVSGTDDAGYNAKRTIIQTVATNKNIVFCDLHTVSLIAGDYQTDGLHLTASGLQKLADKIKATLDAQGWTAILQN
jgi:lysophospholipase L1-like esterase